MVSLVHKTQPIRVDENSPILAKATKVDSLCTADRDYYLLAADAATEAELNSLSLQQSDSLSTTISEESDSVHVYDLNKRETKILRHDIIKLSRNPIGECDNDTHTISSSGHLSATPSSPLESTIQQFNRKIFEHAKETRKPPKSPTKLKSVHLNRNPRKFKMADMQLSSEETIGDGINGEASMTTMVKTTTSSDNNNVEIVEKTIETETRADGSVVTVTTEVVEITQHLLESERENSAVAVVTAVESKSSTRSEQDENSNASVEVSHEEAKGNDETFHVEVVDDAGQEKVHEETIHTEEIVDDYEPIVIERQIEGNAPKRKLTDAEIVFDQKPIYSDDAANVEIVPASIRDSFEHMPAATNSSETHSSATTVVTTVDHGNVTVVRENQLEVVIVS